MKIERIEIKNFKTLENIAIDFDGYFSAISGRNNAGKTTVIKAIKSIFKGSKKELSFFDDDDELTYSESKTQWVKTDNDIKLTHCISVSKSEDPGLHSFVKKIAVLDDLNPEFKLKVIVILNEKGEKNTSICIEGEEIGKYETGEIFQRLSLSNIIFLHNSAGITNKVFNRVRASSFHEMILSKDEKEEIKKEQERIGKKLKNLHRSIEVNCLGY